MKKIKINDWSSWGLGTLSKTYSGRSCWNYCINLGVSSSQRFHSLPHLLVLLNDSSRRLGSESESNSVRSLWPHELYSSAQFSHSVVSDSLQHHGLQHAMPPCPLPIPGVYSNSCPLSRWCHPTTSSSVVPFSCCLQSFPAPGSFPVSQFFIPCGQSVGVSASTSVLPMNIQDWPPLGWTGLTSLQSKGLSRVFSNTTV